MVNQDFLLISILLTYAVSFAYSVSARDRRTKMKTDLKSADLREITSSSPYLAWTWFGHNSFLVADTQLYKRLCPSVGPSVGPLVIELKRGKRAF